MTCLLVAFVDWLISPSLPGLGPREGDRPRQKTILSALARDTLGWTEEVALLISVAGESSSVGSEPSQVGIL